MVTVVESLGNERLGGFMRNRCILDAEAVIRFGCVARQAFQDLDGAAERTVESLARVAESIPCSAMIPAWCETACTLANLVQHSADHFGRVAEHTDRTADAVTQFDRAVAAELDETAVRT
ncbi:hypothetical protein ACWDSJ_22305 [Nocardia sp. NPDC003482]